MEITEIVLLAAGGIIFILSFLIPDKKGEASEQSKELVKEEIADMVSREMDSVREQVDGVVEEAVTYAMEKTERSLERLSNEKIMAVSEYSDTVLTEIHKNHEEAMFLYDMLNSKHDNLKNTVSAVNRTVKEVEEKLGSMQEVQVQPAEPVPAGVTAISRLQTMAQRSSAAAGAGSLPAASIPATSMPATSMPQASVSQPLMPAASVSMPSIPATSMPQASVSQPLMPAASMPATSMPATSMSQTSVPMPSMPAASVPTASMPAASMPAASMPAASMPQTSASADVSAGRVSFLQERAADGQNNNERILELYRQGKSKVAIARDLGLGVGEVKLVIDLFRNQ
ncbi:MAG: DUF6115 domain-containing protein [Acetatifactor muris]|nr:DUF6115 domain-containing protein [Acetatifactor muris]